MKIGIWYGLFCPKAGNIKAYFTRVKSCVMIFLNILQKANYSSLISRCTGAMYASLYVSLYACTSYSDIKWCRPLRSYYMYRVAYRILHTADQGLEISFYKMPQNFRMKDDRIIGRKRHITDSNTTTIYRSAKLQYSDKVGCTTK